MQDNQYIDAGEDMDAIEVKASAEAVDRIKKAKAKADLEELVRRRSSRNKKTEDTHAMDKAENMAKGRNLEVLPEKKSTKGAAAGSQQRSHMRCIVDDTVGAPTS